MKKNKRLIAFMNSYSQGRSGGDMVFVEIAKRLRDYKLLVVTSRLGQKLCKENGVRAKYLITTKESEFRGVIKIYFKRIISFFRLGLMVEEEDILWGTSDFLPDVLPIFYLKLKQKKLKWVQHIYHLIPSSRKIPFLAQRLSFLLIRKRVDLVVVDNSILKKELTDLGFSPQKIEVNYPGIDLNYLRKVKKTKEQKYVATFMAQLRLSKGVFDLISVWKNICERKPKSRLAVIGRGGEEVVSEMERRIKKEKLGKNIDLLGFLPNKEAFTTIKNSKVFIFPSHEEGFGIAPLEAQALGVPVVAWNLPVFGEVFRTGMIKVKRGKLKEISKEVITLLEDKNKQKRLSNLALKNANQYNWDKTYQKEISLFQKI